MSLLQIAEPGMSTAPHEERFAVGIDLGTTNSLVATVRNGAAEVLLDESDRKLLPSVVHYGEDGSITVGEGAEVHIDYVPEAFMTAEDMEDHCRQLKRDCRNAQKEKIKFVQKAN